MFGTIDGQKWDRNVQGTLTIDADGSADGRTPWEELLESALCHLSAPVRREFLEIVAKGQIPPVECSDKKRAEVAAEITPAVAAHRARIRPPNAAT